MSVLCGIDVLARDQFRLLRGKRIGLITNHTGLAISGASTIDLLHVATDVNLACLFSPEHGIRGALDEKVGDSVDAKTGLPIYSLYGASTSPTPKQLEGLDALVFDIQDIGCRFYTYISTLGLCLEAANKAGIGFYVLDRLNPITGTAVEGPIADKDALNFVAWHPIPVRHGLTIGELARLYQRERFPDAKLTVIPCESWRRKDWFDGTGLTWTNPSPDMRSLTEATLYPGVGLLETTNVSVGRGTDTPFEIIGAPWIDGRQLASELNSTGLRGVRFIPIRFTPRASVHSGVLCGGFNLLVTDRRALEPVRMGLQIAICLQSLYGSSWQVEKFNRLLTCRTVFEAVRSGASLKDLNRMFQADERGFRERSKHVLIYR
jgi:uncharacterized protein YbbC (DUF1343 family)